MINDIYTRQKQREQRIMIEAVDKRIGLPVKYLLIPMMLLAIWAFEPEAFSQTSFYIGFGLYAGGTVLLTVLYRRPFRRVFQLALICVWIEEVYLAVLAVHTGASTHAQVVTLVVLSALPILKTGVFSITHGEYLRIAASGSVLFLGLMAVFEPMHAGYLHFWLAYLASWSIIITGQVILGSLIRQREERLIFHSQRGELFRKLITAQEEERKRIARELHDDASQAMAALMVRIEAAEVMLANASTTRDEVRKVLAETRTIAAETLDSVHRMVSDLRPILLDDLGLIPAIRAYAREYKEKVGINVNCTFNGLTRRLHPDLELVLFRVIQETLTNAIKHAGAKTVDIALSLQDDTLTVSVQDDGRGFDVKQVLAGGQQEYLGISGMQERVTLAGGVFTIESQIGDGTRISIELPAREKGEDNA